MTPTREWATTITSLVDTAPAISQGRIRLFLKVVAEMNGPWGLRTHYGTESMQQIADIVVAYELGLKYPGKYTRLVGIYRTFCRGLGLGEPRPFNWTGGRLQRCPRLSTSP